MPKVTADMVLHKPRAAYAEMKELSRNLHKNATLASLLEYLAVDLNIPNDTWLDHFVLARMDDGKRRAALDTEPLVDNGHYDVFIVLNSSPSTPLASASTEEISASASSVGSDSSPRRTRSETMEDDAAEQDSSGAAKDPPFKLTIPREHQMKRINDEYKKKFLTDKPIPSNLVGVGQERSCPPGVPEKPSMFQMADYYMRKILVRHGRRRLLDHTFDLLSRTTDFFAPWCIGASKAAVALSFEKHAAQEPEDREEQETSDSPLDEHAEENS